jgi:hypothetical protein
MACLNPNCRTNKHTGVCRAGEAQAPLPIAPAQLVPAPAMSRPVEATLGRYDAVLAETAPAEAARPDRLRPRRPGPEQSPSAMQLMEERFQREREGLLAQIRALNEQLSAETSRRRAAEQRPESCPECAPQQACPPPEPCPVCPSCGTPQAEVPSMGPAHIINPSVIGRFIGEAVGPVYTESPSESNTIAGPGAGAAAAAPYTQDTQTTASDPPNYSVAAAPNHQALAATPYTQDARTTASDPPNYSVAAAPNHQALAAAAVRPGVRIAVNNPALRAALAAKLPPPTSGIQGNCKNCGNAVSVGRGIDAAVGAYQCPHCGYAHVGAPRFVPSPACSDSRVRRVVKQYRTKLLSLAQAKNILSRKFNLSPADVAYCLSR